MRALRSSSRTDEMRLFMPMASRDGYWPDRKTMHRPPKRLSSQTSHGRLPTTTADDARSLKPFLLRFSMDLSVVKARPAKPSCSKKAICAAGGAGALEAVLRTEEIRSFRSVPRSVGYSPGRKTTQRPLKRTSSQASHWSGPVTTSEEIRSLNPLRRKSSTRVSVVKERPPKLSRS